MSKSRAPETAHLPASASPTQAAPSVEHGPLDGYGNAFLAQLISGRFSEEDGLQALGQASKVELARELQGDRSMATGSVELCGDLLHEGVDDLKRGAIDLGAPVFKGFGELLGLEDDDTELATGVEDFRISAAAGFAHGAIDMGVETGKMLFDPRPMMGGLMEMVPHMAGPVSRGAQAATELWDWYKGDKSLSEAGSDYFNLHKTHKEDMEFWSSAWHGFTAPIREDWDNGREGEAVGRAGFELLMLVDPAAEVAEGAASGLNRLSASRRAARENAALADANRVAKAESGATATATATTDDLAEQAAKQAEAAKLAQPLTLAEVQQGLDTAGAAMSRTIGDPLFDASKVKVNLMDDATFLEECSERILKQEPSLTKQEALAKAQLRPAYITGTKELVVRQSVDRAVLEELLTHEVGHTALDSRYMAKGNEAINEAMAQWLTSRTLGRETVAYPEHLARAEEMAAILGKDELIELIRTKDPDALQQALNDAIPGEGDRLFGELKQAHNPNPAAASSSTSTANAAAPTN